jgi:ribokinase
MILVFGSINLDLIFPVPVLPGPGQTVLGPAARIEPGGTGANQAVAAARDGAKVVFAGAVGRDALAEGALRLLHAAGVDLTRVAAIADAATGCAAICVDPAGRNQIAVAAGANRHARGDLLADGLLGPNTTLLMQMECDPAETVALARRARALGARVILNLAPAAPFPAWSAVDVLVVNEDEAGWLAHALHTAPDAASLHAATGCAVVRTLGAAGAEAAWAGGSYAVPGRPITPVDTTAAGDTFCGVLAAALSRGVALPAAIARANAAAALACIRAGSQGSVPTAAETDAASG